MAPRRRRRTRRPRPPRFPWLALLTAAAVVLGLWWGLSALKRQISGYFESAQHAHRAVATHATSRANAPPTPKISELAPLAHATPFIAPTNPLGFEHAPRVAVIIDDVGNNLPKDQLFLTMPATVTLAILPVSAHGHDLAVAAQDAGIPIMLHLPMEPVSADKNPGPGAITTDMSDAQIEAQLEQDLASLPAVPGVNNHMGSKGTADPRVMRDVLDVLKKKHLFFIDSETSNASLGEQMARDIGVPTAARDIFLDNDIQTPLIEAQLLEAQKVALARGQAIAIGHPNAETAEALKKMIPQMQAAGIEFVPAETLVR